MKMTSSDGFTSIGCLKCNPVFGVMVQAMTEAEAINAWNTRVERTCHDRLTDIEPFECSECYRRNDTNKFPNYCWYCGAKVTDDNGGIPNDEPNTIEFSCGHLSLRHDDEIPPEYCPDCGARVME